MFLALLSGALSLSGIAQPAETGKGCVAHLVFDEGHLEGQKIKSTLGGLDASISGPAVFTDTDGPPSLLINQRINKVELAYTGLANTLPKQQISVEAWVAIDKTTEWGGIVKLAKPDSGWALGYLQSSFSFGVAGNDTKGLTHVRSRNSLEWGRWYHVVGTYDGNETRIYVNGKLENSSTAQKGAIRYPESAQFLVGSFEDFPGLLRVHEIGLFDRAFTPEEVSAHFEAGRAQFPNQVRVKLGPTLRRLDASTVELTWETEAPCPSVVMYGQDMPPSKEVLDSGPKTHHRVTINDIEEPNLYTYRIKFKDGEGHEHLTRLYEFDPTIDYVLPAIRPGENPYPEDNLSKVYSEAADRIVRETGLTKGFCLVAGCGEGRLAYELAKRTDFTIVGVDEDEAQVAAARKALDRAGLYGSRVTVRQASLSHLPFPDYMANLIVSDRFLAGGKLPDSAQELYRVLRPYGGAVVLGRPAGTDKGKGAESGLAQWLAPFKDEEVAQSTSGGAWSIVRRKGIPGAGEWTHEYGEPGNSGNSFDTRVHTALDILWFGRPGPRPMMDRGTRSPAPISTNGYLFVQGDRRLFGVDAYNGTIYWALEIPDFRRANMPRDTSNMTAAKDGLYAAVQNACWRLHPYTGEILSVFEVEPGEDPEKYDWGYLGCVGDTLYGSGVRKGALFIGADGEWYDRPDEESLKVTSDFFFALDRETGKRKWTYRGGLIIDPTISLADGAVYFVECRNPAAISMDSRRLGNELFTDQYLVALDAATGKKLWERPEQFEGGSWVFYLLYAKKTLLVLGTTDQYHLHAFDAADGSPLWDQHYGWRRDNHGGSMQHPVVVGDVVYGEPKAFDLRTGKVVHEVLGKRDKCGTMSGAENALFFRDYYHTMWDLASDKITTYEGVRSGCWLNIIPAGGVLLAPEASSGCFCDHPVQTSIAFVPKAVEMK
jgi:outer membrane protein assembly factor BamB